MLLRKETSLARLSTLYIITKLTKDVLSGVQLGQTLYIITKLTKDVLVGQTLYITKLTKDVWAKPICIIIKFLFVTCF